MINGTWWTLSDGMVESDKEQAGVYELGTANNAIVYVGSSDNLKRRLKEHVNETENACIKTNAKTYCLEYNPNYKAREKQLYDEYVKAYGKPPSCNKVAPTG